MRIVQIQNNCRPEIPPIKAGYCDTFWCQARGLSFRKRLAWGEGLLLVQARQNRLESAIHMLWMSFDLAVFWINRDKQVVDAQYARRWRPIYVPRKPACYVLELAGIHWQDFQVGEYVSFEFIS